MSTQPLIVLAIRATQALQVTEHLRADVQQTLRIMPASAFLSPEGDHYELSQAIAHLHAAERSLLSARSTLRAVADRQPRPLAAKPGPELGSAWSKAPIFHDDPAFEGRAKPRDA